MRTHIHTYLALVNAFPSSLPSTPLDTDIPSKKNQKKTFIREKSAFSLSLFFSLCISLHFSLSLSFCRSLTQSFNTMNEQWVLCTPLNFQIQCVCVCLGVERRDSSHQLKFSFCTALVDKEKKALSCGPFKEIILMQSHLKGRKNSQVQIWASFGGL